jgi:peroxiredoxin Q/BCP
MSDSLKAGSKAPAFQAPVVGGNYETGQKLKLSDLKGETVVLYFYPKDDTPGCTKQACALRDGWKQIAEKARVFGVSIDSVKSHDKFIKKHELPFPLISDEDMAIVNAYGVWVEKSMYGKTYMGPKRSSPRSNPTTTSISSSMCFSFHLAQLLRRRLSAFRFGHPAF